MNIDEEPQSDAEINSRGPRNPFESTVRELTQQLEQADLNQSNTATRVHRFALTFALLLLRTLHATVGVAAQTSESLARLTSDAKARFTSGTAIERSAHAVAIGAFALIRIPFLLVYLPFALLGHIYVWLLNAAKGSQPPPLPSANDDRPSD